METKSKPLKLQDWSWKNPFPLLVYGSVKRSSENLLNYWDWLWTTGNPEDIINLTSHLFHCSFSWSLCCLSSPLCMFPPLDFYMCCSLGLTIFIITWHALTSFLTFPKRGKVILDGECCFSHNCHPCLA